MSEPKGRAMGALITYQLPTLDSSRRTRFAEKVLGQDRKVGNRSYRRRGLLDRVPHWKVNRAVVVVRDKDRARVVKAIREWTDKVFWWPIPLTDRQRRQLSRNSKGL